MIYDLSKKADIETVRFKLNKYAEGNKVIELKLKTAKKTIQQGKYIHVIFKLFGIEFGYTESESKTHLKRQFGNFMYYEKLGEKFLLSTADMTKDQMQVFIEWILNHSAGNGFYIPTSDEYIENQFMIDREIEKAKAYL